MKIQVAGSNSGQLDDDVVISDNKDSLQTLHEYKTDLKESFRVITNKGNNLVFLTKSGRLLVNGELKNTESLRDNGYSLDSVVAKNRGKLMEILSFRKLPKIVGVFTYYNCFVILENNDVYSFGISIDSLGRGGNGDEPWIPKKVFFDQIEDGERIEYIAPGGCHTLFLTSKKRVFGCGLNSNRQCGVNEGVDTLKPQPSKDIPSNLKIIKIAAGRYHSLFLSSDYDVYGAGSNSQSQLGFKNTNSPIIFKKIVFPKEDLKIQKIRCGWFMSAFITFNGVLYICGEIKGYSPKRVLSPIKYHPEITFKDFSAGWGQMIFLSKEGEVFSQGFDGEDQCGCLLDYENKKLSGFDREKPFGSNKFYLRPQKSVPRNLFSKKKYYDVMFFFER